MTGSLEEGRGVTAIVVDVLAEDVIPVGERGRDWSVPVEAALARLTRQEVDVDGGDGTGNIATIGQGAWTLVIDLPEDANLWLNARWDDKDPGQPFSFRIEVPDWIEDLIRIGELAR